MNTFLVLLKKYRYFAGVALLLLLGFGFWNIHSQYRQNQIASMQDVRFYASHYIKAGRWQVVSPDAGASLFSICSEIVKSPYEKVMGCVMATVYKNGEKFSAPDENYFLYPQEKYDFPVDYE